MNETNIKRLWGHANPAPYVKDGFHEYVVFGNANAVNPEKTGTKAAAHYVLNVGAGGSEVVKMNPGAQLRMKSTSTAEPTT